MALVNQYEPAPAHQIKYLIQEDSGVYYKEIQAINIQDINKIFLSHCQLYQKCLSHLLEYFLFVISDIAV